MMLSRTLTLQVGLVILAAVVGLAQTRQTPTERPHLDRTRLEQVTNWPTPLYWQPSMTEAQSSSRAMRTEAMAAAVSASTTVSPALFVAVTPCRLLDTRTGQGFGGAFGPPSMPANAARTIPVPTSSCGLPVAEAYSLNFTVVPPAGAAVGYVKAWPDDQSQPNTAVLTDTIAGAIVGNSAIVPAGADGGIQVLSQFPTDLVIDINGYFVLPSSLPLGGTAAAPALTFRDVRTGIYADRGGTISFAIDGVNALTIAGTGAFYMNGDIYKDGTLFIHNKGLENLGVGIGALPGGTGQANTAIGVATLQSNTTGTENTAVGFQALQRNTVGLANTAVGLSALFVNTTGNENTAVGFISLTNNSTGSANTATGTQALMVNSTGSSNTGTGFDALNQNTTGSQNTALGSGAGSSLTTGSNNVALGNMAGAKVTTGNYNVYISNQGTPADTNLIRIGDSNQNKAFIAGVRSATTGNADAIPVVIDSKGQLGTVSSSRRVKSAIRDMRDTTETIMNLHPVEFRYTAHGPDAPVQFGLIAEEVAETAPELVAHKPSGEIETVYYDKVNAMLLKQAQTHQRTIDAQATALRRMEERLAALEGSGKY